MVQEAVVVLLLHVFVLGGVLRAVAQRLADDEGVVGRRHDGLVLGCV